ncbi:hypothetical protein [Roseovarius nubinhibens]|uniref:Uncharacterized protein n=1 Tax=Roseovarius nubinhibens (strain ATCC BAA-591 / DSM 15170 / ISM) TaxID=89187 RepID=A3SJ78_ROSNI|nr:hypothetical protein [Roseovarius nubinhibens]EAP77409.1 hypothetical protein ISM_03930 [Roseovarius nubinhibens ISM]
MTQDRRRTAPHRLIGLAATAIFAVFAGNIILAKISAEMGLSMPRLPARTEFALLLAATGLGVLFLIKEERRKG